jgi:hypothetical protein
MKNSTIRFVHVQEEFPKYNGFTVAYERSDTSVFFSYAMCCKPDQYVKSIGRDVSVATYQQHSSEIIEVTHVDSDKRVGCVSISSFISILKISSVNSALADHVVDNLSMMDFKHAFISNVLVEFIIENMLGPKK